MIVRNDKTYESNSNFPKQKIYDSDSTIIHVIDETTPGGQEIAYKVKQFYPYYDFVTDVNGNLIDITQTPKPLDLIKQQRIAEFKQKAAAELSPTDYKVIRHRDQLAASLPTTLTDTQYQQLLLNRQAIRDKSNTLEAQVQAATAEAEVNTMVW